MKVSTVVTNRLGFHQYFWQIVYEWEDIIAQKLGLGFSHNFYAAKVLRGSWRKLFGTASNFPVTKKNAVAFVMRSNYYDENVAGRENIVPIIIDFWERSAEGINEFAQRYQGNPAVIITSREVYEYIKDKVGNLRVFHWPLSLPDHYRSMGNECKVWDCALVGRPSRVLNDWVFRYAKNHPDFTYVFNDRKSSGKMLDYWSSRGEHLGNVLKTRDKYFKLLQSVRVGLYSTPSVDDDKAVFNSLNSNGYDQVTPRFFEYLAAHCHVIARYPDNADTRFFGLSSIAPHVASYKEFESRMDYARAHAIDEVLYRNYLQRNGTSARADELQGILDLI